MKLHIRHRHDTRGKMRILLIVVVMTLMCLYQLYWLIDQYKELDNRLREDIQEVLRSSDFEELVHRVEEIERMKYHGRVDVSLGYDHKKNNMLVRSEANEDAAEHLEPSNNPGNQLIVSPSSFASVLKKPDDLIKVGLNMQRGIHSALDEITEINLNYLDDILTRKLIELGLEGDHQLLYLRNKKSTPLHSSNDVDTIERLGHDGFQPNGVFRLDISGESEYVMTIPQWRITVLKRMAPVILFSAFTFLLLILTFRHLIRTMRRQQILDELKSDFTNNITHELKTPIAVAYAANDSLLNYDSANNTPRMNRYLKVCQEQLSILDCMVEQILSTSMKRAQSVIVNIEEVNVKKLVDYLVSNYKIKNKNAVFTVDINENLTLRSDRIHLSNIINNLIDNAIKYSRSEADITLTACRNSKAQTVIMVIDKGIGITEEQQKFIFDKFYRVPHGNIHDVKGYGLGLFYVKNMTEQLGGMVDVKSEYGKGSCFILKFN